MDIPLIFNKLNISIPPNALKIPPETNFITYKMSGKRCKYSLPNYSQIVDNN